MSKRNGERILRLVFLFVATAALAGCGSEEGGGAKKEPPSEVCHEDGDCPNGRCVENACEPFECLGDEDCPDGRCVENTCEPFECLGDEDCPDGRCVENACEPFECRGDEDCADGRCVENACEPYECLGDEDCPDGRCVENACVAYECLGDEDCPDGRCVENACVAYECQGDEDCPDGLCVENACVAHECQRDEDCSDGWCVENTCEPYDCLEDDDCPDGTCEENACVPYECTSDEACLDGICMGHFCVPQVKCALGSDYPTLQSAVDDPLCGTIEVPPGSRIEINVTIGRKVRIEGAGRKHSILSAGNAGRHFILENGAELKLVGFTISNGKAPTDNHPVFHGRGGAIVGGAGASLYLDDILFIDNEAEYNGGAIYMEGDELVGEDCEFNSNVVATESPAAEVGGGAIASKGAKVRLLACEFKSSRASSGGDVHGGAIMVLDADLELDLVDFEFNRIEDASGDRLGGAVYVNRGDVFLQDVEFSSNGLGPFDSCSPCGGQGGALYHGHGNFVADGVIATSNHVEAPYGSGILRGGAFSLTDLGDLTLKNSTFAGNIVQDGASRGGGAIHISRRAPSIPPSSPLHYDYYLEDVKFEFNVVRCQSTACQSTDGASGGALRVQTQDSVSLTLDRVLGRENKVDALGLSTRGGFAAFSLVGGSMDVKMINSTLSNNQTASQGAAFALNSGLSSGPFSLEVYNSTIYDSRNQALFNMSTHGSLPPGHSSLRFRNSIVFASSPDIWTNSSGNVTLESSGWLVHPGSSAWPLSPGPGDLTTWGPGLLPIAQDGQGVWTHAPSPSSPVHSAGEPGGCTDGVDPIVIDQRGVTRTTANCTPGAHSD